MPLKRLALLQYHKSWDVCANRLSLLRAFNPEIEIYGLFGGATDDLDRARSLFTGDQDAVYHLRERDGRWTWQHTDLAVRAWYVDFGHALSFDVVHVVQWDLLYFDALSSLYAAVPPDALALTGITPIQTIADRWHWTLNEPHKTELLELGELVRRRYDAAPPMQACLGPGYALPRTFLDQYANLDVPEVGHDELRLPLFARILGFAAVDPGFYPRWFDTTEERYFNANGDEIDEEVIRAELLRPGGRRVFHPFHKIFEGEEVEALLRKPRRG